MGLEQYSSGDARTDDRLPIPGVHCLPLVTKSPIELYDGKLKQIEKLYPLLEPSTSVAIYEFPPTAEIAVSLHPTFLELERLIAQGIDVGNTLSGAGATGEFINRLKVELGKSGLEFPTRGDELTHFRRLFEDPRPAVSFQFGAWPFNDGSMIYVDGLVATTQDHIIAQKYAESRIYGSSSSFTGIGVDFDGKPHPVEVFLDVTSYANFKRTAREALASYRLFLASSPEFIRDGVYDMRKIFSRKRGDSRHFETLPFFGGLRVHTKYGDSTLSGSVFLAERTDINRRGEGAQIWEAMSEGKELAFKIGASEPLLRAAFASKNADALAELERVGIDPEKLEYQLDHGGVVSFVPQIGLYNRAWFGIRKNDAGQDVLALAISSGLLNGKVSGRSGIDVENMAKILIDQGFTYALPACEGRDPDQAHIMGIPLTSLWNPSVAPFIGDIGNREVTSPDIKVIF